MSRQAHQHAKHRKETEKVQVALNFDKDGQTVSRLTRSFTSSRLRQIVVIRSSEAMTVLGQEVSFILL